MHKVHSADGAAIAYEKAGHGVPLLVIHGDYVDHAQWSTALPFLAQDFAVHAMDRRGHGASDPYRAGHTLERDIEDALAPGAAEGVLEQEVDGNEQEDGAEARLGDAVLEPVAAGALFDGVEFALEVVHGRLLRRLVCTENQSVKLYPGGTQVSRGKGSPYRYHAIP